MENSSTPEGGDGFEYRRRGGSPLSYACLSGGEERGRIVRQSERLWLLYRGERYLGRCGSLEESKRVLERVLTPRPARTVPVVPVSGA